MVKLWMEQKESLKIKSNPFPNLPSYSDLSSSSALFNYYKVTTRKKRYFINNCIRKQSACHLWGQKSLRSTSVTKSVQKNVSQILVLWWKVKSEHAVLHHIFHSHELKVCQNMNTKYTELRHELLKYWQNTEFVGHKSTRQRYGKSSLSLYYTQQLGCLLC